MNENGKCLAKDHKFDNLFITELDSITDNCFKDCHNKNFHKFNYDCIYDFELTNITINEIMKLTVSSKSMTLYDINKELTVAKQNGFVFDQIKKLIINIYSHKRYINISYYLKFQIARCHRQFFRLFTQNREIVEIFCKDMENLFHFACQKWFNQLN